ncbi:1-phosphatidylinositol 3-phosphate 5-kinase-like isoform X3 [Dysidea avara]|uniref:1-phosphatidylinositol 3-phosphate 5-kinase-like isoform X3 n=1 Tax=Dysidea avara TaxID=196820 RepID=UPI0033312A5D
MSSDKLTWFKSFAETGAGKNNNDESPGWLLKRPQRASVQIDEQKQSVRFEKSTERFSTSEVESVVSDETEHDIVYTSPPRSRTPSNVINKIDTISRNKDAEEFGAHHIWLKMLHPLTGLKLQSHHYQLMHYPDTLTAREITDWLVKNRHASSRGIATRLGQVLVDTKRLNIVNADQTFRDESHVFLEIGPLGRYELQGEEMATAITPQDEGTVILKGLPSLSGNYENDSTATIVATEDGYEHVTTEKMTAVTEERSTSPVGESISQFSLIEQNDIYQYIFAITSEICTEQQQKYESPLETALSSEASTVSLVELANDIEENCKLHVNNVLNQLLCQAGLSSNWYYVIQPLIMEAGYNVKPDINKGDSMNICDYVQIKKIPGGSKEHSSLIYGIVCSKNVTNKRMQTSFQNPRILLLTCSIEFERTENKLSSFDRLCSQEYEYLKNLVARIHTHKPDIIMVQGSIAKSAQDMLYELGVTLAINVKLSVLKRVARLTQGDLLISVEQLLLPITLGSCGQFYLKGFCIPEGGKKTLMCFDHCTEHLGCCVILQGASKGELRKVKEVFRFAVYAAYNACLEAQYLHATFAAIPVGGGEDIYKFPLPKRLSIRSPDCTLYPLTKWPTLPAPCNDDVPDIHNSAAATIEKSTEVGYQCKLSSATTQSEVTAVFIEDNESDFGFANLMNGQILSVSCYISFPVPHLMSSAVVGCDITRYLPSEMFWSAVFKPANTEGDTDLCDSSAVDDCASQQILTSVNLWERPVVDQQEPRGTASHSFTTCPLLLPLKSKELSHMTGTVGKVNEKMKLQSATPNKNNDEECSEVKPFSPYASRSSIASATGGLRRTSISEADRTVADGERTRWAEPERLRMEVPIDKKMKDKHIDCLTIQNHQSLSFLYWNSSRRDTQPNKYTLCMTPMLIKLPYYVGNDLSLGEFLNQMCFRSEPCLNCHQDVFSHQAHFVHYSDCLRISVFRLPTVIPGSNDIIYNWYKCKKCQQHTPHMELTKGALSYSFAKFLEMKFYDHIYVPRRTSSSQFCCQHPLGKTHIHCFCQNDIVAVFDLVPINLLEIIMPPKVITILKHTSQKHNDWSADIKFVSRVVEGVFHRIKERLVIYGNDPSLLEVKDDYIAIKLKVERKDYRGKLKHLRELAVLGGFFPTSTLLLDDHQTEYDSYEVLMQLQDKMFMLKRSLMNTVGTWNKELNILHDFIHDPPAPRSSKPNSPRSFPVNVESDKSEVMNVEGSGDVPTVAVKQQSVRSSLVDAFYSQQSSHQSSPLTIDTVNSRIPGNGNILNDLSQYSNAMVVGSETIVNENKQLLGHKRSRSSTLDMPNLHQQQQQWVDVIKHRRSKSFDVNLNVAVKEPDQVISSPQGNGEGEGPQDEVDGPQQEHMLLEDDHEVDFSAMFSKWKGKENDDPSNYYLITEAQGSSSGSLQQLSTKPCKLLSKGSSSNFPSLTDKKHASQQSKSLDPDTPDSKLKLLDCVTVFSKALKFQPLPPPFKLNEHHTLRGGLKIPVAIYEKEPSSVIAFTLSSREYACELAKRNTQDTGKKRSCTEAKISEETVATLLPMETAAMMTNDDVDPGETSLKWNMKEQQHSHDHLKGNVQKEHIILEFSDYATKFSCKVYFAEEFRQLRELVFPYGEERFIRSLARCVKWQAKGGKSGSSFCKVVDDRFILKQMKRPEVDSFVEFANDYFKHLRRALDESRPTALAKIVGMYWISFNNSQTNDSMEGDFLVIENLLYGHKCSKVFDLKGSVSRRYVQPGKEPAGESQVYLDENFLEHIASSPIYLRSYSKAVLMKAIQEDTKFLSHHNVMDYSMLTGIDENSKELVLGMIDFVRTFTWDKLLEMWIKKYVSRGGRLPTVVSPDLYRKRFCEAMEKYFYQVPDKWSGMANENV